MAIAAISDKAEKIHQRDISSEDVTGEIVDTRSRMEAKKQVKAALPGIAEPGPYHA